MRYIKQFCIILAISFAGEILNELIPLPIPASIYGIVILFAGLCTGAIPLDSVKETGKFLVEIMPVMFIPAAVGLINSWGLIRASWLQYLLVTAVTTVAVMAAAGLVTQFVIIRQGRRQSGTDEAGTRQPETGEAGAWQSETGEAGIRQPEGGKTHE